LYLEKGIRVRGYLFEVGIEKIGMVVSLKETSLYRRFAMSESSGQKARRDWNAHLTNTRPLGEELDLEKLTNYIANQDNPASQSENPSLLWITTIQKGCQG
jgi:hypothetical protein